MTNEWISVKSWLPDNDGEYLILMQNNEWNVSVGFFSKEKNSFGTRFGDDGMVTHWAEIPRLPLDFIESEFIQKDNNEISQKSFDELMLLINKLELRIKTLEYQARNLQYQIDKRTHCNCGVPVNYPHFCSVVN